MRAVIILFILPVIMSLAVQLSQSQPLSNDHQLANENDCIEMTDEKVDEIKRLVQELTGFIDALAEKHEDLDLRLIKLDVDHHNEFETEDKSTVLELFINDCSKKFNNKRHFQNTDDEEYENDATQSIKDEENNQTASNNQRKKDRASNTNRRVNSRDKSITKFSLKRKNKSNKYEKGSNYNNDKMSVDDFDSEDNRSSYLNSNDEIQSSIVENESYQDETPSADDSCSEETSSVNKNKQSANKNEDYNDSAETSTSNTREANKIKSTSNDDNYTDYDSRDTYEENNEKSSMDNRNQPTKNNKKDSKKQTKNAKNPTYNNKITSDMEFENDNYYTNQKSNKIDGYNQLERSRFSPDKKFLRSLRQIIRNEIKTTKNDFDSKIDNDATTENDETDSKYNNNKTHGGNERTSKPEFVLLDLENDALQLMKRQKCNNNNPLLVYLQERMGQQRIMIL